MKYFHRRVVLKGALGAFAATAAAALGLLVPRPATAAEWPRDAYAAKTMSDALRNLYGTSRATPSPALKIRAPSRLENGAVVPVAVSTDLPDVRAISVLVEKNSRPLAAHLSLTGGVPYFSVNVKMAATSNVHFVVDSGGKLYSARRLIKVVISGCGG